MNKRTQYYLVTFHTPIIDSFDFENAFAGIIARIEEVGEDFYLLKAFFKTKNNGNQSTHIYVPYANIAGMAEIKEIEKVPLDEEEEDEDVKKPDNIIDFARLRKREENEQSE